MKILVINPGSTSTKIAVFENDKPALLKTIRHSIDDLDKFTSIADQYQYRKDIIIAELHKSDFDIPDFDAVIGRGGLLRPIESGVYRVNDQMIKDLSDCRRVEHASNLGALIAYSIASTRSGMEAFIADPIVVDELEDIARVSGHPLFDRISIFHALNHKAVAKSYARSKAVNYEDLNLVVVHLGGGISVGAHLMGRVIDVNQALDGEGPFTPERSGTLPMGAFAQLCFSGQYTLQEVKKMITGHGGLSAYLETNNAMEVEQMIENGDHEAKLLFDAMAYQVAKEIGAMATVLKGEVDAILITGGLANSNYFVDRIIERVKTLAPIVVYPGEDEMKALAMNALMVLKGEVVPKEYV
jgi:butyrate kinase